MNLAVEFMILLILLGLAIGELLLFVLAGPVLRRMFDHASVQQLRLEQQAKQAIPAGIFRPVKGDDGTIALYPAEDNSAEESTAHNEVVGQWLTKMGLS